MQFNLSVPAGCKNCSAGCSKSHWSYTISMSRKLKKNIAFKNFIFCHWLYSQRTKICLKKWQIYSTCIYICSVCLFKGIPQWNLGPACRWSIGLFINLIFYKEKLLVAYFLHTVSMCKTEYPFCASSLGLHC